MENIHLNLNLSDIKYFCDFDQIWKVEKWKEIKGYESFYMVSDLGRVKSFRKNRVKILKSRYNKDGYLCIGLYIDSVQKMFLTHRLVAISFIDNPHNKETINHKNGIKNYNLKSNLEWNTRSENIIHADRTGLRVMRNGENCYKSKLKEKDVIYIRKSNLKQSELAKMFNINPSAISTIISKKNWKHL